MLIHALLAAPLLVALDGSGRAVTERAAHASPRAWLEASPRGAYTVLRSERSRVAPPALRFHLARLRASLDALEPRGDARAAVATVVGRAGAGDDDGPTTLAPGGLAAAFPRAVATAAELAKHDAVEFVRDPLKVGERSLF